MASPDDRPALAKQIENEITDYLTKDVQLGDSVSYSQHKLTRRIFLFETHTFKNGKFDTEGNYKLWPDIIAPCIDSEVKNIDFDTKNIEAYSPREIDEVPNIITNLKTREWCRDNGQDEEINSAIEEGAGWGNIAWKRTGKSYERCDLRNFYVINQTARTLKDTPVIERHQLSHTQVRNQKKWKYMEKVLEDCGQNSYKTDASSTADATTTPYYLTFERNGEVCLKDLKEYREEPVKDGDDKQYVYAKVIAVGTETTGGQVDIKYIVYAQQAQNPYKEYHRGRYKGRWFREGLYELLFDNQVRATEIANEIALALKWASKVIFTYQQKLAVQNILTDLKNGDAIRAQDLKQLEVRAQGIDQLIVDWNRNLEHAKELANSFEIVQGDSTPGQPFKLGQLLDVNANKLYVFIRQKLSIPLRELFEEWIIPQQVIPSITVEEVIRLTGDSDLLSRIHKLIVENWYIDNLIAIGPHTPEVAEALKAEQMEKLKNRTLFLVGFNRLFAGYKASVAVVITGENVDLPAQLQTLATFIQLELDPVRRSYLIEKAMRLKGIDTGNLPRSTPEQLAGTAPAEDAAASPLTPQSEPVAA